MDVSAIQLSSRVSFRADDGSRLKLLPQHFLYFLPLPHKQRAFRPTLPPPTEAGSRSVIESFGLPSFLAIVVYRPTKDHVKSSGEDSLSRWKRHWSCSRQVS